MKARHARKDPRKLYEAELQKYAIMLHRLCGRDDCRPWHPANEGARSPATAANLKAQGMWVGVADIVIFFAGGHVKCIELKTPSGRMTPEQREFRDWCEKNAIPYALCTSSDEIANQYREWNVLRDGVHIGAIPAPTLELAA